MIIFKRFVGFYWRPQASWLFLHNSRSGNYRESEMKTPSPLEKLSEREKMVFLLLGSGKTTPA
jgi:hypothetical protein